MITAILIPKRNPRFPAPADRHPRVPILFLAQLCAVYWVTETQEVEEATPPNGRAASTARRRSTCARTDPDDPGGPAAGDAAAGKEVFESAGCVGVPHAR